MDICHLMIAELEPKHHKYKGRFVLGGDIVKDDSGADAENTEQGSFVPHMTFARLFVQDKPPMQYQLTPKQKWRTLQGCWRFQSQSVQIYGYVFHDTSGPNLGQTLKTQRFFLNEICTHVHLRERIWKTLYWDLDGNKNRIENVCFVLRKQGLFLSIFVDDIKMVGRKQILGFCWVKLMTFVDLGESTSLLEFLYLGCTQREC